MIIPKSSSIHLCKTLAHFFVSPTQFTLIGAIDIVIATTIKGTSESNLKCVANLEISLSFSKYLSNNSTSQSMKMMGAP